LEGQATIDGYWGDEDGWADGARFDNIDAVLASNAAGDVIRGPAQDTFWQLAGRDSGTVWNLPAADVVTPPPALDPCDFEDTWIQPIDPVSATYRPVGKSITFANAENVRGNSGQDWFEVGTAFQLTESLGGGGNVDTKPDTLDYRLWTTPVSADLNQGIAAGAGTNRFAVVFESDLTTSLRGGRAKAASPPRPALVSNSIENLLGGSGDDTLVGDNDLNAIRGYAGQDTINGKAGIDDLDAGVASDVIEVAADEAVNDSIRGGYGKTLDATDFDVMRNVGEGTVFLAKFNTSPEDFGNSIDEYQGNGYPLSGTATANELHLGLTPVRNTTGVLGANGDDDITAAPGLASGPAPYPVVAYDGGIGNDQVTLALNAQQFGELVDADLAALQNFLKSPATKSLSIALPSGAISATNFEIARIAVYDDGVVMDATSCFLALSNVSQIKIGTAGDDSITGTMGSDLIIGMAGNDSIDGLDGNDCAFGGAGLDTIIGRGGNDTLFGGSGVDSIYGETGDDFLYGGNGADLMWGGEGIDWLLGQSGDDTLRGEGKDDFLYGGGGNDDLFGDDGNDQIFGEACDDDLFGGQSDDILDGGDDRRSPTRRDRIDGGLNNDIIRSRGRESEFDEIQGGLGSDTFEVVDTASPPADLVVNSWLGLTNGIEIFLANNAALSGNAGDNTFDLRVQTGTVKRSLLISKLPMVKGGAGNDTMQGTDLADNFLGEAGDDTLYGNEANDTLDGGDGNDTVWGGIGNDLLIGGGGNDSITGELGIDRIQGDAGNDVLRGGNEPDTIFGGPGNDSLFGDAEIDSLFGESGNDVIQGGAANDIIDGGSDDGTATGFDSIDGGDGDDEIRTRGRESEFDVIRGGARNDRLVNVSTASPIDDLVFNSFVAIANQIEQIFANKARIVGNSGNNVLDFRLNPAGAATVKINDFAGLFGLDGNDVIHGTLANDTIDGGAGIDSLYGYAGNDTLLGGDGNDFLDGGAGNDSLRGGNGDDSLNGNAGNDTLEGNDGVDILIGGAGNDWFVFQNDLTNTDTINDFGTSDMVRLVGYGAGVRFDTIAFDVATQALVLPTTPAKRIVLSKLKVKPTAARFKIE
jgi:Ca2+-binding RTX toxin-like protein